jgi:hypothetical protein
MHERRLPTVRDALAAAERAHATGFLTALLTLLAIRLYEVFEPMVQLGVLMALGLILAGTAFRHRVALQRLRELCAEQERRLAEAAAGAVSAAPGSR